MRRRRRPALAATTEPENVAIIVVIDQAMNAHHHLGLRLMRLIVWDQIAGRPSRAAGDIEDEPFVVVGLRGALSPQPIQLLGAFLEDRHHLQHLPMSRIVSVTDCRRSEIDLSSRGDGLRRDAQIVPDADPAAAVEPIADMRPIGARRPRLQRCAQSGYLSGAGDDDDRRYLRDSAPAGRCTRP